MTQAAPSATVDSLTGTWTIDPVHSALHFSARHAMVATVRGRFAKFAGTLELDAANPSGSKAEVTIEADSIDTGQEQRDAHLRSPDFLDAERHPQLTFHSTRVAQGRGEDDFTLWGDLSIRGVTRQVELDLHFNGSSVDPYGNVRSGFEGSTTINRRDWGLTWNAALEAGGVMVGDKIRITIDIAAIKQQ